MTSKRKKRKSLPITEKTEFPTGYLNFRIQRRKSISYFLSCKAINAEQRNHYKHMSGWHMVYQMLFGFETCRYLPSKLDKQYIVNELNLSVEDIKCIDDDKKLIKCIKDYNKYIRLFPATILVDYSSSKNNNITPISNWKTEHDKMKKLLVENEEFPPLPSNYGVPPKKKKKK
eukprot:200048_1